MKRFAFFGAVLVMLSACIFCLGVPAFAGEKVPGEVLYHQDFSILSDMEKSGIVRGTSGSAAAELTCTGETLELNTFDNERIYAILPPAETAGSYTIEFDFSFAEIRSANGYIGFILTCRGTEPTNVTALVIRADGTIDDFDEPEEVLKKAIADGGKIQVKIPVEKNVLHKIELTADGKTYTLERRNVKVLEDGGRGFVVRNASVNIGEVSLVDGIGYTEKYGIYADESYAADEAVTTIETLLQPAGTVPAEPEKSPATGETIVPYAAAFAAVAVGLFRRRRVFVNL